MKWRFGIFINIIIVLTGCNNNAADKQSQDSTVQQSSTLPPETNYVMENNVNEPVKKNNDAYSADTTATQMMTPAVDTAVIYMVDSVKR